MQIVRIIIFVYSVMLAYASSFAQTPQIISTTPGHNELNVSVSNQISVMFDVDINGSTINSSTFLVYGDQSTPISGTVSYNSGTQTAIFNPGIYYNVGELITVYLTDGIETSGGEPLTNGYAWSFTVESYTAPSTFEVESHYEIGNWPWRAISADFNGDGHVDIATADNSSQRVSILLNDGFGAFPTRSEYLTSASPSSLRAADLDNDGDLDIAVSCIGFYKVTILINNGNGAFSSNPTIPVEDLPEDLCVADFNGDGNIDIATANYWHGSVGVTFGNGDGTFEDDVLYFAGAGFPYGICAGDFENDGDIDIAAANLNSGIITVYYNNGDGTFSDISIYTTGWQSMAILTADLDGDGYLDLATSCVGPNSIVIHLNNGDGTFAEGAEYQTGNFPLGIDAADFDGDGHIDIVVAGNNTDHVYIHTNNGDGTFSLVGRTAVLRAPCSVTSADYDGDGDIDIAAVNRASDTLSVLYNREFIPTHLLVANSNDNGWGSLRWAIDSANNHTGLDSIRFAIYGSIDLETPLPALVDNSGALILGSSIDGYPQRVTLDGSNLIAGNGIDFQSSNNIVEGLTIANFPENGVSVSGASSVNNLISGNLIYNNELLGIDLGGDGVTLNDPGDSDTGPNNLINYPETDSLFLVNDSMFSMFGSAGPGDRIEMYYASNSWSGPIDPDPSGHGEAARKIYHYPDSNYADAEGKFVFEAVDGGASFGAGFGYITLIAIDSFGNTSEFSENQPIINPITFTAHSSVNLWITDPNGDYIGKDADGFLNQTIETAEYIDNGTDNIIINRPLLGQYTIEIIPETGANPDATYSIGAVFQWQECMLAVDMTIPEQMTTDSLFYNVENNWHYRNGDADRNNDINILDITYLIMYVYTGGPAPYPLNAGDANCDLSVNLLDITYLIGYLYNNGPAPCEISK